MLLCQSLHSLSRAPFRLKSLCPETGIEAARLSTLACVVPICAAISCRDEDVRCYDTILAASQGPATAVPITEPRFASAATRRIFVTGFL